MLKNAPPEQDVPLDASAAELLTLLRSGALCAQTLVSASLRRMYRWEEQINAMISLAPDALEQARACDLRRSRGEEAALLGLPVVIKDNINTVDLPTTFGARALRSTQPREDAALVRRLRAAGAVIVGKSSLSEFASSGMTANSLTGQTRNPYDLTRTPGGSSGGSAAAVAMGFAAIGIGTDGVNSVRSPASACALVGLRPSAGSVDRTGMGLSSTRQDMPGILVRTAEDAALALGVLRGAPCVLPPCGGLAGRRIALLENNCGSDAQVLAVVEQTRRALRAAGAEVTVLCDDVLDAERMLRKDNVIRFEQKQNTDRYLSDPANGAPVASLEEYLASGTVQPEVYEALASELTPAWSAQSEEYARRLRRAQADHAHVRAWMAQQRLDAVLYPVQRIPVVKCGAPGGQAGRNGIMASCLGFPAVCFPGGFTQPEDTAPLGVPVGMELMGLPGTEEALLSMVNALMNCFPVRRGVPLLI